MAEELSDVQLLQMAVMALGNSSIEPAKCVMASGSDLIAYGRAVAAATRADLAAQKPAPAPTSDGEREAMARELETVAEQFDQGTPEERAMERAATLLRQPAPAPASEIAALMRTHSSVEPVMGASRVLCEAAFGTVAREIAARWGRPAPASDTPLDLDALLSPRGAYEPGTGHEDGAQLVDQLEWWVPMHGCDTLENLLRRIRARILPHLRPPIAGIDVPGPDGDYGGLQELCDAEGVDVRIGAPLLKRAQKAWGRRPVTPEPTSPTLAEAREAARQLAGPAAQVVHQFLDALAR
jgi:hypothetical protein